MTVAMVTKVLFGLRNAAQIHYTGDILLHQR